MNKNALKWVEALESGEYEQGRTELHEGEKFCCLGVACELFIQAGGELPIRLMESTTVYANHVSTLPWVVRDWLGLDSILGVFHAERLDDCRSLASLNDRGVSFEEIAKFIRSEPEGLFN